LAVVPSANAAPQEPPLPADHAEQMARGRELFTRHVRQILLDNCVKCHGGEKTRSGLDLTTRESLLKGGDNGPVVVPHKAKASRLLQLVSHLEEPHMPPKGDKLSDAQRGQLAAWIDLGAPYDKPLLDKVGIARKAMQVTDEDRRFWSFLPLQRHSAPAVKQAAWCKNPIDHFILARLEEKGLSPNPQADRRKLIRRSYFDLIGLPPTPEDVEAFVRDDSADAYEKLIDRLLANPHHGERWARHWLDLARFAESHGYEQDYDRPNAYHYRDFVIKAFNDDLPYDTFVRWQLAGDEIESDNPLALMATGFLAAGVHSTQITKNQVEKERYDELDDMARIVGTAFLGLTVGCARCHDHKYDPIPTKDYYRLLSTFTKTVRSDYDVNLDPKSYQAARAKFDAEHARLVEAREKYEKEQPPGRWRTDLTRRLPQLREEVVWVLPERLSQKSQGGATLTPLDDGSLLASDKNPDFDTYTLVFHTHLKNITAIRLEALAHPSLPKNGPGRAANGNFALSDFKVTAAPLDGKGKAVALKLVRPQATFEQKGLPVAAAIDNDGKSAWAVDPQIGKDHSAVFELETPAGFDGGTTLTFTLAFKNNTGHSIGRPRLALATLPVGARSPARAPAPTAGLPKRPETSGPAPGHGQETVPQPRVPLDGAPVPEVAVRALAGLADQPDKDLTDAEAEALRKWHRTLDPQWRQLQRAIDDHLKDAPKPSVVKALICSEGVPAVRTHTQGGDFLEHTHFLNRGDPNQKGEIATQGFLEVLTRHPDGEKHWQVAPPPGWRTTYQRRGLAAWLTDVEHGAGHLLARVIVNRLWQHHMGRGLVGTPSDFGFKGEKPTHPELLDWLARELIDHGWSLKHVHKLIMTSAAYRQGNEFDKQKAAVDPDNLLHWRRAPQRLEAEVIRDSLLAVAGTLDPKMYGPGTLDPSHRRRSIYFFVKRSQLVPMMVLFDAPEPLLGIEQRTTTTIAPQALLLLNNKTVRDSAEHFARRIAEAKGKTQEDAVRAGYLTALGRGPGAEELTDSVRFIKEQEESYKRDGKADARHLALTDFCQVLLGLNEFLYID
jgi:mono/diheme cytochrome c family protein